MACAEKIALLAKFKQATEEYRAALAHCRVCRKCHTEPSAQKECPLETLLVKLESSQQAVLKHYEKCAC